MKANRKPHAFNSPPHAFGSPLARDLFSLVVGSTLELAAACAEDHRVAVEQINEAEAARRRAAAESDELRSEGRRHLNTRPDRNE